MSAQNKFRVISVTILLIAFIGFMTGCNDDQEKTTSTDQAATTTTPTPGAQATNIGDFNFLALHQDVLKNFFDPADASKKCDKVVFRFAYDQGAGAITSEAFGAKKNDKKYILPPTPLDDLKFGIGLGSKLFLSDLELDRKTYEGLGAPGTGQTHLIFYPTISTVHSNAVTYKVRWGAVVGFVKPPDVSAIAGPELNPSPPADPGQ